MLELSLTATKILTAGSAWVVSELAAVLLRGSWQGSCVLTQKGPPRCQEPPSLLPPRQNPLIPPKAPEASNIKRLMLF